uniref:Uncharacterized protein n=1 Tax=Sphaerodactylus townsendi TaxID=933632 RepID=A0ACB8F9X2_9SAUR
MLQPSNPKTPSDRFASIAAAKIPVYLVFMNVQQNVTDVESVTIRKIATVKPIGLLPFVTKLDLVAA